ncbi:sulfotransferase family protein [Methylocystis rosea]|uniref:Sulfotransferase family protein n=1 Tax=Methylocystis rosea TaxID=173366 RepID=A0A3G8MA91_9HYPH|nr:hypothetical protein [Methylocystis rosea]AZG78100.1 hypothetical protein EHO51_15910 [Methylocystis rosea]
MDDPSEKTAIVILGMHRSGTSSIAGTLVKLGGTAPKSLMPANEANQLGYFESIPIMELNDEILASATSSWHDWRAFDPAWYNTKYYDIFREKAKTTIVAEFGDSDLIVVKDPRICRVAPFWFDTLKAAGYRSRVVMPLRSPLEVATSLQTAYGFDLATGMLMWLRHTLDAETESRSFPRAVVYWPDFLSDWRAAIARLRERFDVTWPNAVDAPHVEVDQFLTPSLRHFAQAEHEFATHPDVNEWVQLAYEAMFTLARDPCSRIPLITLDQVKGEFDNGSTIFSRVLFATQAHIAKLEADAAAARIERDAMALERDRLAAEIERDRARFDALALSQAVLLGQLGSARDRAKRRMGDAQPTTYRCTHSFEDVNERLRVPSRARNRNRQKGSISLDREISAAIKSPGAEAMMCDKATAAFDDQLQTIQASGESIRRNIVRLQAMLTADREAAKADRIGEQTAAPSIHAREADNGD